MCSALLLPGPLCQRHGCMEVLLKRQAAHHESQVQLAHGCFYDSACRTAGAVLLSPCKLLWSSLHRLLLIRRPGVLICYYALSQALQLACWTRFLAMSVLTGVAVILAVH